MATPKFMALQILCLSTLLKLSQIQSLDFEYNGFNNSNLVRLGATLITPSGALKLTSKTRNQIGHAFHPTPIPMFNNSTNASSFSTHFVFQISSSSPHDGGYGFAFVLTPNRSFDNPFPGQYLGVFNPSNQGNQSNHIFMVEFDTVNGGDEGIDRPEGGNHVGINRNGVLSEANQQAYYYRNQFLTEPIDFSRDGPIQTWIDYYGSNQTVDITISPLQIPRPQKPLISYQINLSSELLPNMYVGFSAATGESRFSSHFILSWTFRLNGPASSLDRSRLPNILDEILNTPSAPSSNNNRIRNALIVTFSVVLFVSLGVLASTLLYRRVMNFEVLEDWELDSPHRFRHRDLYKATKGFNETEKIGSGGFGSVYKGILPSTGGEVAVKRIRSNNQMQGMREFAAEIESLGKLRHKNLVNLQGWCKYKNDLLLVYDYVPNGSLDSLLFNPKKDKVLSWEQRYNIVRGVASGLLYLHEEWEKVVIHRDVKSSNVLIDRDMNARLGDFGLARSYDHTKKAHTTSVVGTIGYIAPELTRTGKASKGTDVFAFGILLLEVACGRGPVVYEVDRNVILVDWVAECMRSGNMFGAVDARLGSSYDVEEMELVLGLGLLCSHTKPENRPSMRQVVKYLNRDEMLPLLDRLSEAGSRRVDEITSRFLALGLTTDSVGTSTNTYVDCGLT